MCLPDASTVQRESFIAILFVQLSHLPLLITTTVQQDKFRTWCFFLEIECPRDIQASYLDRSLFKMQFGSFAR